MTIKLTATMLRKIISEEVSKARPQKKTLSEAITRITEDEMAAWKGGNWGYVAGDDHEDDHEHEVDYDDNDRFLHGSEHGEAHDDEGYMAKSQLASMKEMAYEVCELLDGDDQLPGWVQNHLAVAHENLRQVHGYLTGDTKLQAYEEEEKHGIHAEAKGKGPSKKTAQKILRGTKTFKDKVKKVEKWADDPEAAAAWMMHKAAGKWPSEK